MAIFSHHLYTRVMKTKTVFFCKSCGFESAKWAGKCAGCEQWNTFVEETVSRSAKARDQAGFITLSSEKPVKLADVVPLDTPRFQTEISEMDRVLGGGLVPSSLVLLGGDPGIGKSTLILQILHFLTKQKFTVLYVTGEESKEQIKMRAERLGITPEMMIVAENSLDKVIEHAQKIKPQILVIDSIQTVFLPHLESAPGSVSQVRECTGKLLYFSKTTGTATILIGHVTKEGAIAGPRVLEHMVDTVLYFEGENTGQFRILRTMKNRYGSTNEIGVFEMTALGLQEVKNPSEHFLEDSQNARAGSCVTASLEGTRPILIEIQSLVSFSQMTHPRRTAIGVDPNRVALIIAVLEKIVGINLYQQDIYVNAAGGLKIFEPACDMAILLSLLSSFKNTALPEKWLALGEIGLTGEVRAIPFLEKRVQEAQKMGYTNLLVPKMNKNKNNFKNINVLEVSRVDEVVDRFF